MKKRNLLQFILQTKELIAGGLFGKWAMIMVLTAIVAVFFNACEKFEDTPAIYKQEPAATTGDPSITGILPTGIAKGGVREITILGHNLGFSKNGDTNWVFIGGKRAIFKEVADDHIIIYRPVLDQSNYDKKIYINVTNPKAIDTSSRAAYTVETTGLFVQDYSFATGSYIAFESDKNDNLYVLGDNKNLYFVSFSGAGTPPIELGGLHQDLKTTSDMKLGPGSKKLNFYFAYGKKDVSRVMTDSAVISNAKNITNVAVSLPAVISKLDFDPEGNMYAGGNGGIYFVKRNSDNTFSDYLSCGNDGLNLVGITVFGGSVYFADSSHVWKSTISADGTLGGKTELVNTQSISELSAYKISSFVLDENGGLYLCIKAHPKYSLFFVESSQSVQPYYNDPNIIPGQYTEKLVWGNGRYLYLTKGSISSPKGRKTGDEVKNRVYRLYMDKNGAVYNGRKFNQ